MDNVEKYFFKIRDIVLCSNNTGCPICKSEMNIDLYGLSCQNGCYEVFYKGYSQREIIIFNKSIFDFHDVGRYSLISGFEKCLEEVNYWVKDEKYLSEIISKK